MPQMLQVWSLSKGLQRQDTSDNQLCKSYGGRRNNVLYMPCCVSVKNNDVWYVGSACSNHMASHESLLINVDTNVIAKVKMGT